MDATAKLIAIIVLVSFATERILAATSYVLDSERMRRLRLQVAERRQSKERRKLLLLALGATIALAVVDLADLRILRLFNGIEPPFHIDYWLTWLVVFAGGDRVRDLLQGVKADRVPVAKEAFRVEVENGTFHQLPRAS